MTTIISHPFYSEKFPLELKVEIFSRISYRDLIFRVSLVCKELYNLVANNNNFWKIITCYKFPSIKKIQNLTWKNIFKKEISRICLNNLEMAMEEKQIVLANSIFTKIIGYGLTPPKIGICNSLIHLMDEPTKGLGVFLMMKKAKIKPNVSTYNALLNLYLKKGYDQIALLIIEKMKEANLQPNIMTYNALLNFYMEQGRSLSASLVLYSMQQAELQPNHATYSMLIHQKDRKIALLILNKMNVVIKKEPN